MFVGLRSRASLIGYLSLMPQAIPYWRTFDRRWGMPMKSSIGKSSGVKIRISIGI
jgi:hypothetical protein